MSQLVKFGVQAHEGPLVNVRLADQSLVRTKHYISVLVQFSDVASLLKFTVLPSSCPPILGMPFLRHLNPMIDWQRRTLTFPRVAPSQLQTTNQFQLLDDDVTLQPLHNDVQQQQASVQQSQVVGSQQQRQQQLGKSVVSVTQYQGQQGCYEEAGATIGVQQRVGIGNVRAASSSDVNHDVGSAKSPGVVLLKREVDEGVKQLPGSQQKSNSAKQRKQKHAVKRSNDVVEVCKQFSECMKQCVAAVSNVCQQQRPVQQPVVSQQPAVQPAVQPSFSEWCDSDGPVSEFNRLVQAKRDEITEINFKTFKRELKKGQFQEAFYCFSNGLGHVGEQQFNFTHRSAYGTLGEGDIAANEKLAQDTLAEIKRDFPAVFSEPTFPVNRPAFQQHHIQLKDPTLDPPRKKLYPLDSVELAALKDQLDTLLSSGRIRHSSSPYGAPILFAKKKEGSLRMCIDYRALNTNTILDRYPLPRIDDLLQRLQGAKIFSKLDLRDGYHQIPMDKNDAHKTAFVTRYGQFEFTVMPFGLCNAPATFQRVMNQLFFRLLDKCVLVYIDDILIYSRTVEEHKRHLREVFTILQENNFRLKEKKCALFLKSCKFLGYTVDAEGLHVEQGKVQAVADWKPPTSVNEVQQFLGLANYYRRFIKSFASHAGPLTNLTKKKVPFSWGERESAAFSKLKDLLCSAPCLAIFDRECDTRLCCDASGTCVGAVLEQRGDDGEYHPVEFFSKRLNDAQCNYSATEREMLAVILSLERWRQFLIGIEFTIYTDHASLTYLLEQSKLSRRQAKWLDFLSQFKFQFSHVAGKMNNVADALSRAPFPDQQLRYTAISLSDQTFLVDIVKRSQGAAAADTWFQQVLGTTSGDSVQYAMRNGILCKLVGDYYAPVIPPTDDDLKRLIMLEVHSSGLGGHVAFKKMYSMLQSRFYWPKMRQDVDKFIRECHVCQQSKVSTQSPSGLLHPHAVPARPFEHVSLDFITHLPRTAQGHDSILTIVDRFSKLVILLPVTMDIDAASTAQLFFNHVICKYGMPSKIISDRDARFTSLFWQSLFKCLQCKLNMSSAYHPQTDGQSERFNRSIEQVIRCYCNPAQDNWDVLLPQVSFALNASVHAGTQHSAFSCIYGYTPQLPIDVALSSLQDSKVQAVHDVISARARVHRSVMQNLERYNEQMKQQVDKKRRHLHLQVGDLVWVNTANLRLPGGLSRKFAQKWLGPFRVANQMSPVSYSLQLPDELSKVHPVFHVSLLKRHHGSMPIQRAPVFTAGSEEGEFEVDRVIGKRIGARNRLEYLVQWKGYGSFDATWEPAENLKHAKQAVQSFERSVGRTRGH